MAATTNRYVICVRNDGYDASLETRKVYRVLPDAAAAERALVRVVDESGEDYLFPTEFFVPIDVPERAEAAFQQLEGELLEECPVEVHQVLEDIDLVHL